MSVEGLNLPLMLILIVAPIGAFDVMYYHIYKFRLATRPASRSETLTHIVRSASLGAVVLLITLFRPTGLWFWAVAAILAMDFVNSLVDGFLEKDARAELGGLPRAEYMIHLTGATFMGGVALTFLIQGWHLGGLETALAPRHVAVPALMRLNALVIAASSFALAVYEAVVVVRSARRPAALGGWKCCCA